MAWWNPVSWWGGAVGGGPAVVSEPGQGGGPSPDLSDFMRGTWTPSSLGLCDVLALGTVGAGCTPSTRPELVPLEVLDAIGTHPVVYTMESIVTGPAKDPDLYFVRCDDKKLAAEVEAWLRPLLTLQRAPLLSQILRAFALGSVPIVLDYGVADLSWDQEKDAAGWGLPASGGGTAPPPTFRRTAKGHVHFVASHEVWPADATLRVENDKLLGVVVGGQEYGGEDLDDPGRARAFLSIWDPQFGRWDGQGSRRRCYKDWLEGAMARLWELRALERVVDPARVGYAPEGSLTVDGRQVSAAKLLRAQMLSLKNGSVIALPGTLDANGKPLWRLEAPFQSGVGTDIAKQAIDSRDVRMAWACLSPGGPVSKATEEQFLDQVQALADFAAMFLTRMVNVAVRVSRGPGAPFVQVVANDIPKRKLKIVLEVFRAAKDAVHTLPDGRTFTLAQLVDPEILDQLAIKALKPEAVATKAPPAPAPAEPGRKLDTSSARDERRDNADTIDGESDTGGDNLDRQEQV